MPTLLHFVFSYFSKIVSLGLYFTDFDSVLLTFPDESPPIDRNVGTCVKKKPLKLQMIVSWL